MNTELLITFVILNIVNVIIQTIKSIATVQSGKTIAALTNAFAYGFYTIVTIYMLCDLPLMWKAGVVAACNLVGVYVVKYVEEKMRKDKLWKVELTVRNAKTKKFHEDLERFGIPHNYIPEVGNWTIFNCYCATQKESAFVKEIADHHGAKYFVSESKNL